MVNNSFSFKQFTVNQEKSAMKVCTDACLFGAWLTDRIEKEGVTLKNCLDIGTGTGLLALMLAQKIPNVIIDAVEIDEAAVQQGRENFEMSPWKERLRLYQASIQQFANSVSANYDLIISNPPFYENELKSKDQKRNLALHGAELSLVELTMAADKLLAEEGNFFVLLPWHRTKFFEGVVSQHNFFIKEKMLIRQTPKHNYFRTMLWLNKKPVAPVHQEVTIMSDDAKYTPGFTELLKDYYLYL